MNFSFSHAPFPGPTVSDALAAASRAAGDAYARRVLRPSGDEGGSGNGGAVNKALLSLLSLLRDPEENAAIGRAAGRTTRRPPM